MKRFDLLIITSLVGIFMTMKVILNLMKCKEVKTLFALVGTEKLINFMPIDGISFLVTCNQRKGLICLLSPHLSAYS